MALGIGKDFKCKIIELINHSESLVHVFELLSKHETCQLGLKLSSIQILEFISLLNAFLDVKFWKSHIHLSLAIVDSLEELNEVSFGETELTLSCLR